MSGISRRIPLEVQILSSIAIKLSKGSLEDRLVACGAGIGGLHFNILRLLQHNEHTLSEISRRLMFDPSTLVPVVDMLERKGLLERSKDPSDRRRTPLLITDAGHQLLARVTQIDDSDPLMHSLSEMGEVKARQFVDLLRDLVRYMPNGEEILAEIDANLQGMEAKGQL